MPLPGLSGTGWPAQATMPGKLCQSRHRQLPQVPHFFLVSPKHGSWGALSLGDSSPSPSGAVVLVISA